MGSQADKSLQNTPLEDRDQVVEHVGKGFNTNQLIGFEQEKIVVGREYDTGRERNVDYGDIRGLLQAISSSGFEPVIERNDLPPNGFLNPDGRERAHLVGLKSHDVKGRKSTITLEPAGQFEIAAAPKDTVHDVADEYYDHLKECNRALQNNPELDMLNIGAHPTAPAHSLPMMPRERFKVLLDALARNAQPNPANATATTQINLDVSDDNDLAKKMQTALAIQPVFVAIFAASPFEEGKPVGSLSRRNEYWSRINSNRVGIPGFVFDSDFGLRKWIDFEFDKIRMIAIQRGEELLPTRGGFLQEFIDGDYKDGFMACENNLYNEDLRDIEPTLHDAVDTLAYIWTEARVTPRGGIELRGCDTGTPEMNMALTALVTGLFYDEQTLDRLHGMVMEWPREDITGENALYKRAPIYGLETEFQGHKLLEFAHEIVDLAQAGLDRRAQRFDIKNESSYLTPLKKHLQHGMTPADHMLKRFFYEWGRNIGPEAFSHLSLRNHMENQGLALCRTSPSTRLHSHPS